jgi:hypothetical protein
MSAPAPAHPDKPDADTFICAEDAGARDKGRSHGGGDGKFRGLAKKLAPVDGGSGSSI